MTVSAVEMHIECTHVSDRKWMNLINKHVVLQMGLNAILILF